MVHSVAQVFFDAMPFLLDNGKNNRVPVGAISIQPVIAEDAVLLGSKFSNRIARGKVKPIGLELNTNAIQFFEGMLEQQVFAFTVKAGSLDAFGVPGKADLKAFVLGFGVAVPGAAHDFF